MSNENFPVLASELALGPIKLRNRTMMSAHGMGLADGHNSVSPRYHAYLMERARGGAALLGMESAPVSGDTQNRSLRIRLYEDQSIDALSNLAQDVHSAGGLLSIMLWHGGHTESFMRGTYALSPSPIPNASGEVPKVISPAEIKATVKQYAAAAARCAQAGLDAVEVQTSTNYLLGSFLNPSLNHRSDEYGGSRTNRLRIVYEVLDSIRQAVGDSIAVGIRTSVRHGIVGATEDYDDEESLACMMAIAEAGLVDWVHLMTGSGYTSGESIPAMHAPRPQLRESGMHFKRALPVPVIVAGNIRTPEAAESMLAEGSADVIAMARTWIADPDWANKSLRGEVDKILPCMSCNQGCVGFVWRGIPGTCVLNARAGREIEHPRRPSTSTPRNITVIGGGPAGMESARLAALAGHHVTLHERRSELGGDLTLAAMGPTRQRWLSAVDWWTRTLRDLDVNIQLSSAVEPSEVPGSSMAIWATGAEPGQTSVWRLRPYLKTGIPGAEYLPHGREWMTRGEVPEAKVLVIDEEGGWPTVSLVEWLCAGGASVTVVTTERSLGESQLLVTLDLKPLADRLSQIDVEIITSQQVEWVEANQVKLADGRELGGYGKVVLATGTVARTTPTGAFAVGDCAAPRGIWAATSDARRVIDKLA